MSTDTGIREQAVTVASISRPDPNGLCTFAVMAPPLVRPVNFYKVPYKDVQEYQDGQPLTLITRRGRIKDDTKTDERARFFWDWVGVRTGPPSAPIPSAAAPSAAPQATATAQTPAQRPPIPTFPPATTAQPQTAAQAPSQGPAADGVPHQHTFTVSYGRTINRGNFESERIDFSMEFDRGEIAPQAAYVRVKATVLAMLGTKEPVDEPEPDENANPENDFPF